MARIKGWPKVKRFAFRLYTYDVWGNTRDGYQVNDVFHTSTVVELPYKRAQHTQPDGSVYYYYTIPDRSINRTVGASGIRWETGDGPDCEYCVIYGEYRHNGKPACELRRITD